MLDDIIKKATGGLDGLVDDLVKSATGKVKEKISEAFAINKLQYFKDNVARIGQVKTILHPDSIVHLTDIFFDQAVLFNDEYIESFSQFGDKQVLVEGGPGQGKSLYLRKLCLKEGTGNSYIPIFIEFRNLRYKNKLKEEIMDAIEDLGVKLDNTLFDFLAKSEKILLLLDGFDEVPNNERKRVARELETIVRTYPKLRVVISSRPDSGMGSSFYFSKKKISPMTLVTQQDFVKHLYKADRQSESINNILSNSSFISEITTTPLLLTLFTITYNTRQFKPDSLAEFYSLIFPTMLYRHDRMKIGFERERKAGLTDYQMQRLFDSISFLSLHDNNTRFPVLQFQGYLERAAKLERLPENIEDLLIDDITSITALIIRDGFNYFSFTHKSIQEYFASVFIFRLPESRKKSFYNLVITDFDEFRKWQNTLSFLETIDERNYTKYFSIPYKKKALCLNSKSIVNINYLSLLKLIGGDSKVCVDESGEIKEIYWGDTLSSVLYVEYSDFAKKNILQFLANNKLMIANLLSYCDESDYTNFQQFNGYFTIEIDKLMRLCKIQKDASKYLSEKFELSKFKSEVLEMEFELNKSDLATDEILPF
ncbi:putative signal transduction protein with Nacht domain [Psychromonas ingrahamii 37]|uniref:Putative signal transduction protein with Nacht domain n=1 Tax=Psychromonas ingrahamii (strain DSM 17664 / CCUG 51855 / 37) TaxID=357804 RepID=A1SXA8_PSYIN|nr:NACHT domain-containing protein [Psychromonas ingrahamii]ABM04123.1 putative signal transduction protein with Nacht domain [Psychromonas ingrahamii 37]